jgi:predicted DNA-binding protein
MKTKVTIASSINEHVADKLKEFAESVQMSKSAMIETIIEKFIHAHEKAILVKDAQEYVTITNPQKSYFCPTHLGVMMTLNFDVDFVVSEVDVDE